MNWETPKASPRGDCPSERARRSPCLDSQVNWMTPTSRDHKDGDCREANVEVNGLLGRQVLQTPKAGPPSSSDTPNSPRLWPTPVAWDHKTQMGRPGQLRTEVHSLEKEWPTPYGLGNNEGGMGEFQMATTPKGKKLNPRFVEWLMGLPIGWTALDPVETP